MGIILGILQSFLNASGMILTKKVVENKKVGNNFQTFFNRFFHLLIIGLLIFVGFFDFDLVNTSFSYIDIIIILLGTAGLYITYPLRRIAYANEKVSVLQPFAMLFQVFPIIIGFIFIASERVNIITFFSAILASLIVILPNIDFKKFKINKYSLMVLISSIIKSFHIFIIIYLLTKLSPSNVYLLETILILVFSLILMFFKKEFGEYRLISKSYFKLLIFTNIIVISSILLVLNMYNTLGIVVTSLFSLLYLVFVYILGFFILKEIPSKKDIIIAFLVCICVIVGMWFKVF